MSMDYLELLLMRETRAAPLAEPRIEPGPAAAALVPASGWDEIVEEREAPLVSPPADRWRTDGQPRRADAGPPGDITTAVFPPPVVSSLEQPAVPERPPQSAPISARIAANDASQEHAAAPAPVRSREVISTQAATAAAVTVSDSHAAHAEPRVPRPEPRAPEEPRVIATRPAPVAPGVGPEPPVLQPVTIRIDRVELRAAPAARPPSPAGPRPRPNVSLDDFLKRRSGARRE
jgi:hypothetical protein